MALTTGACPAYLSPEFHVTAAESAGDRLKFERRVLHAAVFLDRPGHIEVGRRAIHEHALPPARSRLLQGTSWLAILCAGNAPNVRRLTAPYDVGNHLPQRDALMSVRESQPPSAIVGHYRLIQLGQHVLALEAHDVPASPVPDLTDGEQFEIRDALADFSKPEFNRATAQDLGSFERAEPVVGIVDIDC